MSIAERLAAVRARIDAACAEAGRDRADVGLIAVSKVHPAAAIQVAMTEGQRDFGESYAQELRDKAREIEGARWHFIGRLQSNKLKYIAPCAHRVHALEHVRHAEALVARAPQGIDALVAVHVGGEASKGGVNPSELPERLRALAAVPGLRVRGLMTLPPFHEDPEEVAPYFAELASLAADARADGHDLTELSMGMSHDFEVAIRHGATWVRVGTAIFGARG